MNIRKVLEREKEMIDIIFTIFLLALLSAALHALYLGLWSSIYWPNLLPHPLKSAFQSILESLRRLLRQ
jgi:hypothetical protein